MEKNVKEHVVEKKLVLLLHHLQVHLPLVLLLLLLVLLEVSQSQASLQQSSGPYVPCHTQRYALTFSIMGIIYGAKP